MIKHSIVYAENDIDDYILLKSAFENVRSDIDLVLVNDGWKLLEYLQKIMLPSLYPCLIILDINMNGIGGKETLQILKATKRYQHILVIMFTSSNSEKERTFYKEFGIEMVTKPSSFSELTQLATIFGKKCDATLLSM